MKKIKSNVVKGWITSIIGTVLMITSLFLWFGGVIPMMWEGAIGIILGCILLMAPRTIEKKVSIFLGAWGGNAPVQGGHTKPDNPDADKSDTE